MPQQIRMRTESEIAYVASGRKREKLDRGMVYRELYLRLTATVAVAGGGTTTAAANIKPGDLWGVVKDINLLLNSNDSIRKISGEQLQWLNFLQYHGPPRVDTDLIGIAASGSAAIESTLILPFWIPNSVKPIDTALDARLLSDVSMEITWGTIADVASGTGASFSVDPKIEIGTLESFGIKGPFNTMRIFSIEETAVAVSSKFEIDLPVGNMYRAFLINAKDGSDVDLVGAISNIKIKSGSINYVDVNANSIRNGHFQRNGINEILDATGANTFPHFLSADSKLAGWTYLDLVTDGLLTEAIDTLGFSNLKIEFNVAATIAKLNVIPIEIIPLRNAG